MTPPWVPAPGFYYHYKHDRNKGNTDYAYEVTGWAKHTETEEYFVIYRPLYQGKTPVVKGLQFARPMEMFSGKAKKNGKAVQRLTRITDSATIEVLEYFRRQFYGEAARS